MSKKLLFLMVFVVLMATGTPAYAGVLFSSDWNTATGDSDTAVTDGGTWDNINNTPFEGHTRLEVFPPDHPVLNGNNYLGVWMNDWMWCGVWQYNVWTTDATDIYYRFYQRTYPHNIEPNAIYFNNGHFVQPFQPYPPDNQMSTNTWFGIRGADQNQWWAYISGQGHNDKWDYPYQYPGLCCLDTGKWYRIEGHIHYFRESTEQRGDVHETTRVPTYTHFRIYDENGVLVKDTDDWTLGDPSTQSPVYTLQEWYDMGRYWWYEGVANSWMMGNNGPYSAQGAGPNWCVDYAAIEIRDDTWPGPVGDAGLPRQASNPSPGNSTTAISVDADLSWTTGLNALSHDVYFGTSLNNVNNAGRSAGDVDGSSVVDWDDVRVLHEQWLLDPTGLYPCADLNGDNIANFVDLAVTGNNWRQQADAVFKGNQTATTFDPGTMDYDTPYYWRIDEVNALGTATGTVWSFTTEIFVPPPGQASNPNPAHSATDTGIGADLSWTAGADAASHDVYFGTDSTPDASEFQGYQIETTFDPGTLNYATTYYWRIDEVNTAGTTTGAVWSFTTAPAGSSVIEEFGDALTTNHPGTVEDTWCRSGSNNNYSTATQLNTYTWPVNNVANLIIIKWYLSAIPTNATIVDATLYLYQIGTAGDSFYDIPVHKIVNVDPVITTCTWNTYDGTNSWTAGGDGGQGDTAAAEAIQAVNSTNNQYKLWTVTNMVADWVSAPTNNYGMLLNSDGVASVDSCRYFASSEAVDASTRPRLVIAYTIPE